MGLPEIPVNWRRRLSIGSPIEIISCGDEFRVDGVARASPVDFGFI
jgi:hypothetical protein